VSNTKEKGKPFYDCPLCHGSGIDIAIAIDTERKTKLIECICVDMEVEPEFSDITTELDASPKGEG